MGNSLHSILTEQKARVHFACAGAGADFIHRLWSTPGSSAYLAGASMLQARKAVDRYIGYTPEESYASESVATDMAIKAFMSSVQSKTGTSDRPLGIAVTASVASNRIPRGEQRAHIALIQQNGFVQQKLSFEKMEGKGARAEQDQVIADALENLLVNHIGEGEEESQNRLLEQLMKNPIFWPNGKRGLNRSDLNVFFPANFNPIHDGHRLAWQEAERQTNQVVAFMIEARPPNKSPIPAQEILRRIAILQNEDEGLRHPMVVTRNKPNYIDKARAFPGSSFVLGADAALRLFEPNWGYNVEEMLSELDNLDTKFLVLGREIDGRFTSLENINPPEKFRHLFQALEGRRDISSSALR